MKLKRCLLCDKVILFRWNLYRCHNKFTWHVRCRLDVLEAEAEFRRLELAERLEREKKWWRREK